MFDIGDAVYHPANGAGVVDNLQRLPALSKDRRFYRICMRDGTETILMIPVEEAESLGLRRVVSVEGVDAVLAVLASPAMTLPAAHKERYKECQDRLDTAKTIEIAEVVRDLTWRQAESERLSVPDMRILKKAMVLLTGELAVAQGLSLQAAAQQITQILQMHLVKTPGG
jgi:CarD family transcriptional regulator